MTMYDHRLPAIPAELMDDQPISPADFEEAAGVLTGFETLDEMIAQQAEADARTEAGEPTPVFQRLPDAFGRFQIGDDGAAEWALRKIAEKRAREREVVDQAQGWRDEINRWEREQTKAPASFAAFLEGHLVAYLRARQDVDEKLRTISLPSGKIKSSSHKPRVGIGEGKEPADEFIAWALSNLPDGDLDASVQTTRKPVMAGVKKICEVSAETTGYDVTAVLSCGHTYKAIFVDEAAVGDSVPCDECPAEFGEQTVSTIDEFRSQQAITRPVVRWVDTGEIVPGAVVVPESMSYKVEVG